jgi:hypothetical protein
MPRSIRPNTIDPVPSGRAGIEIVDEAFDIGVGGMQFAAFEPQCIGRADGERPCVRRRHLERALLVRKGDVGTDKTAQREAEHKILEFVRRYRLDDVASRDVELAQPVMMDQR